MKIFMTIVLIVMTISANSGTLPARLLTFGPMWHLNFGNEKIKLSWGFELAYWQTFGNPGYGSSHLHGVDVGIEFEGDTRRIYGEYQNGEIIYGGSIGPVIEVNDGVYNYGIQGSIWGAVFAGVDMRMRYLQNIGLLFAPGIFVKAPIDLNGGDIGIHGN